MYYFISLIRFLVFILRIAIRLMVWVFSFVGRIFRQAIPIDKGAMGQIASRNNRSQK